MKQNIYDNAKFFASYDGMRKEKKGTSANDLIEIPTIRSMLPDLNGKRVLDLGCGYGENAAFFRELGASFVYGIDISQNMIEIASSNNNDEKVKFAVMSMEDISKINDKFDLIISSLATHYVEDFQKLCHDIYSLLNDGGVFLYSQEHPNNTATILNKECNGRNSINIGNKEYYLLSDYNRNGKRVVDWYDCDVVKYHRNFSCIINTLINEDFQIEEVREPLPSKELIDKKAKYINQYDFPYFLFIKASKSIIKE